MNNYIEKFKKNYNLIKLWFPYFIFCLIVAFFANRTCDQDFINPYCDNDPLFGSCNSGCHFNLNFSDLLFKSLSLFIFGLLSMLFIKKFINKKSKNKI